LGVRWFGWVGVLGIFYGGGGGLGLRVWDFFSRQHGVEG